MTRRHPLWIGGEPRDSARSAAVANPFDGSPAAEAALGTAQDLDLAIASSRAAFEATRRAASHERSAWLHAMARSLEERSGECADIIRAEAGKPSSLARAEVARAIFTFRTAAEEALRPAGESLPLDVAPHARGRTGIVRRFPKGVVAGIVPFNFPLNLAAHKVAPALAAGATIVLKPPPEAPGPALLLAEIAARSGAPAGSVNAVLVPVAEAGALATDPRIAVLSFTGSARTGWALHARAGRRTVVLELGGNAALVVDRTADLDEAADRAARSAFAYAGQVCIRTQRILVEEPVFRAFEERFLLAVDTAIVTGDPRRDDVLSGPVIHDAARTRITAWYERAVAAGATVLRPLRREGTLLHPAVLRDVPPEEPAWAEEVFGPVVSLASFRTFDEAIERVNDSRYGLQAGVFTSDLPRALAAFERIETGAVIVNDAPSFRVDTMPYGGIKDSGWGREGLRSAIAEMTEPRLLVLPPPA